MIFSVCKAVSPIRGEEVHQSLSYQHQSPTTIAKSNETKSKDQVALSVMGEVVVSESNERRSEDQIAVSIIMDNGQIVPVEKGAEVFISDFRVCLISTNSENGRLGRLGICL